MKNADSHDLQPKSLAYSNEANSKVISEEQKIFILQAEAESLRQELHCAKTNESDALSRLQVIAFFSKATKKA